MSDRLFYFAYGSNLNQEQMKQRCPDSIPIGEACLEDYRLGFSPFSARWNGGGATIIRSAREKVYGAVYQISLIDRARLDLYEQTPQIYKHLKVEVKNREGNLVRALTYQAAAEPITLPSVEYLKTILLGLKAFGISEKALGSSLRELNYRGEFVFIDDKAKNLGLYSPSPKESLLATCRSDWVCKNTGQPYLTGNLFSLESFWGFDSVFDLHRQQELHCSFSLCELQNGPIPAWVFGIKLNKNS